MQILDELPEEWGEVSLNKTLPDAVLRRLAYEGDEDIRKGVAMKHRCPEDVLSFLAQGDSELVRVIVLNNKNVSRSILARMRDNDDDEWIRERAQFKLSQLDSDQ
jgi:hypothetical protein